MNLLLLFPRDFISPDRVRLTDHRLQHLLSVKKIKVAQQLIVGLVNGQLGQAAVLAVGEQTIELSVKLDKDPMAPLPVHLILALPRPKMLKRILQTISAMGVKQLSLIHSARVEKSYWQSLWLNDDKIQQNLVLGLEQSGDTMMPEVKCYQRFKPFVEDIVPDLIQDSKAIVAHPRRGHLCVAAGQKNYTLAIGPEGGFIDYEIDKFEQAGFSSCHLGERILRVENAIPVLLARLF